ncbi:MULTISPECIES: hypothetical protein [Novosphingobium]|jgi:hypothetical protein|uniref:Uncharacterized protein n=2 Tax=Sphingomonadaceae TaxID=41297 RepID=A0A0B8ZJU9_9SPHN|nr:MULTISPECIES: hypothetical protein [Novosphingobium]KHS46562.1 hypothetical protein NJ75_02154 [Novosphingobium subterraneum]QOV93241.1 hypothetical protein IM701_11435 [Novosphingobium sp. ES2-1]
MTMSPSTAYGTARHPFRAQLPRHALRELPRHEPEVLAAMKRAEALLREADIRSEPVNLRRISMQDIRDFLIAYCACFLAIMVFIA